MEFAIGLPQPRASRTAPTAVRSELRRRRRGHDCTGELGLAGGPPPRLVPSEIFAAAPEEALKAQAVTAWVRSRPRHGHPAPRRPVLPPVCRSSTGGLRECRSGEWLPPTPRWKPPGAEALFSTARRLVDSGVQRGVQGPHREVNEAVGRRARPESLRGRPDVLEPVAGLASTPEVTSAFLSFDLPAACRRGRFAQPTRYRWERRFTAEQADALVAPLGVGSVQHLQPLERAASPRRVWLLTRLRFGGSNRAAWRAHHPQAFGMLNSALFTVTEERGWTGQALGLHLPGGGWGHGVASAGIGATRPGGGRPGLPGHPPALLNRGRSGPHLRVNSCRHRMVGPRDRWGGTSAPSGVI